jgi:hypothetical protein
VIPAVSPERTGSVGRVTDDADPRHLLGREIALVADRFRHLSESRLTGALPPHRTRAEAGRQLAQQLADAALGIGCRASTSPPRWREVPELNHFAVGDQIAVTGHDLVQVLAGVGADEPAWTRVGRRTTGEVVAAALDALRGLRLAV